MIANSSPPDTDPRQMASVANEPRKDVDAFDDPIDPLDRQIQQRHLQQLVVERRAARAASSSA